MLIDTVPIPSRRVGLPDFDQGAWNRASIFIQHAPAHDDSLSLSFSTVLVRQVVVVGADVTVAKNRAGEFRQSVRQQDEWLFGVPFRRGDVRRVEIIRLRS